MLMEILSLVDPEHLVELVDDGLRHQIVQFTVAFGIAAWIHSGRTKKEIAKQFAPLILAVNNVADTLRKDLVAQKELIGVLTKNVQDLKTDVTKLNTRVSTLETKENP